MKLISGCVAVHVELVSQSYVQKMALCFWSMLPFAYLAPTLGAIRYNRINIFYGVFPYICVILMDSFGTSSL